MNGASGSCLCSRAVGASLRTKPGGGLQPGGRPALLAAPGDQSVEAGAFGTSNDRATVWFRGSSLLAEKGKGLMRFGQVGHGGTSLCIASCLLFFCLGINVSVSSLPSVERSGDSQQSEGNHFSYIMVEPTLVGRMKCQQTDPFLGNSFFLKNHDFEVDHIMISWLADQVAW